MEGRTTIMISHKLSMLRRADRIYFLVDGAIVEEGTHEDLIAKGGHYRELFDQQAAQFSVPDEVSPADSRRPTLSARE